MGFDPIILTFILLQVMEEVVDGGHGLVHQLVQLGGGWAVPCLQVNKRVFIEILKRLEVTRVILITPPPTCRTETSGVSPETQLVRHFYWCF